MSALPLHTWERLLIWFTLGMIVYFAYGVRKSKMAE
jgi:APA family basic amino acid/polyamine antiporter